MNAEAEILLIPGFKKGALLEDLGFSIFNDLKGKVFLAVLQCPSPSPPGNVQISPGGKRSGPNTGTHS